MLSALHNLAFVEHTYLVGILDGRQSVGNGDGGAALHESFECFLHQALALGVECRGGLVEDEEVGVEQQCPSDADALALAAGEEAAALAEGGLVALRE